MKQHEQALLFLRKAAEDEALLDEVLASDRISDAVIGFHFQQAVEKLLKALLSELRVDFRRTHDLAELWEFLSQADAPLPGDWLELQLLTPYAVILRYADETPFLPLDRIGTRELLRSLRQHVEEKIVNSAR